MLFHFAKRWCCVLTCLLIVVSGGERLLAQGPSFPSTLLRLAQNPEPAAPAPAANGSEPLVTVPSGTEAATRDERQVAELNLLAANLADAESRHKAHLQEKAAWEAKLEKLATEGPRKSPPYSFLTLDKARDELASETQAASSIDDAIDRSKQSVTHAAEELEVAGERDVRRTKDELEHNRDATATTKLTQAVADAEHELAVAKQSLALRRAELTNLQLDEQVHSLRQQYAERLVELYKQDVVFTQAMQNEVLADLDARGKAASARARQLTDDLSKFLQPQWYQARERLDNARATDNEAKLAALAAEVQAKDLAQQLADNEIGINTTKVDRLGDLHTAWQHRYALANSRISASETAEWLDATKAASERLRVDAATLRANPRAPKSSSTPSKRNYKPLTNRTPLYAIGSARAASRSSNSGDYLKKRLPSWNPPGGCSKSWNTTSRATRFPPRPLAGLPKDARTSNWSGTTKSPTWRKTGSRSGGSSKACSSLRWELSPRAC